MAGVCSSMLHALSWGANMSHVMFGLHDWGDHRPEYKVVLELGDMVHHSSLLAVFKVKPNATAAHIAQIWEDNIWTVK